MRESETWPVRKENVVGWWHFSEQR